VILIFPISKFPDVCPVLPTLREDCAAMLLAPKQESMEPLGILTASIMVVSDLEGDCTTKPLPPKQETIDPFLVCPNHT